MANPKRAETEITLDGKTYRLKFDFNSICEAEEAIGGAILKRDMGFREIRALVWAGLGAVPGQRRPTLQQVGALFKDLKTFTDIQEKVSEALEAFMGEEPVGDAGGAQASEGESTGPAQ